MTYKEVLDYMYHQLPYFQRQGKVAYKSNLDTTHKLDEYFNHPHKHFKSIHVAGTNGKGSVSHMLASIFQEAGYKVGLYTSPHLKDFRERIKIDGKEISKNDVIDFIKNNRIFFDSIRPSFFEITVVMAFYLFKKYNVDYAVIEVGMGGRLDSTNIIIPLLSIITNVSKDHTEFLGNSVVEIAREKAGIIKTNMPVVIGEGKPEINAVFNIIAKEKGSLIYYANELLNVDYSFYSLHGTQVLNIYKGNKVHLKNIEIDLLGEYQRRNINTVLMAIEVLNNAFSIINNDCIYSGLRNIVKNTGIMGRFQILGQNPRIIADVAHNEEGILQVLTQIENIPYKKLHIVLGFVNDKDIDRFINLFPQNAYYYFTKADIPRALHEKELRSIAQKFDLKGESYPSVNDAFEKAKKSAIKDDLIFVGGSTFVVSEVL